ncbi:GNAT family N-acetyltransferase [Mesorhizobium sp. IMUNJ 23232]|uniref:GNAT family N-acetyltransferase n=1 Tax=Mesorhizobium sp. IMUNJ 23232 TaxID=3376064 RepID=UPI0037BA1F68
MTLSIRLFEMSDREAAVDLFLELNCHEFTLTGDRRTDRGGAEFCVDDMIQALGKGAVTLVAEAGGKVAGLMVWVAQTDEPYMEEAARRYGSVQDIVVAEAHRGKGIGRALLAEAERLTREAGMSRLKLTVLAGNDAAVTAYERAGYRDYARVMLKTLA